MSAVDDCVSHKIPILKKEHPDWTDAHILGAAYGICGERGQAVELVNEVEGVIRGYIALWGSPDQRDAFGTWFDRENPPEMALDYLPRPLMYEHAQDGGVQKEIVGSVIRVWFDDNGIAFEGSLDRSSEYFARMVAEIKAHELPTSSSTAEHTADFDSDGRFVTWILHELSLTKAPAEERMPAVELIRSVSPAGATPGERKRDVSGGANANAVSTRLARMEVRKMDFASMSPEEILKALTDAGVDPQALMDALQQMLAPAPAGQGAGMMSAPEGRADAANGQAPVAAPVAPALPATAAAPDGSVIDVQAALLALLQKASVPPPAPRSAPTVNLAALRSQFVATMGEPPVPAPRKAAGNGGQRAVEVSVDVPRKYWDNDLPSMMLAYRVLRSRGVQLSNEFVQVMSGKAADLIERKDALLYNPMVRSVLKATRSDEIMTSTNTGNGDEWVGVAYDETLWEKARSNRIYQDLVKKGMRVQEVPQGTETVNIFTEGSDPTVYTITQSADLDATLRPTVVVPVTAPGTGVVPLTPGYLGMAVAYSSAFEEDSMIAAAPQLNKQMNEKAEETIEQLMINGDTASTLNVNYDGGTANAAQYFLASNGFRKYALVTGSSTSRDGGALTAADFRLTLKLFPSAIRTRKKQIAFIVDSDLYNTALDLTELKTDDVRNIGGTVRIGDFDGIYGVDLFESGFMLLTDTDGKVTYNAAGTVGQILAIYAPFWAMGWKRKVTIETSKDIVAQANLIVATFRLGFVPRGAGAAVETYNLTIA